MDVDCVRLHHENSRYFLFRDQTLAPVTAAEHYGAVINLDFDYIAYLNTLQDFGFRLTRLFLFYREQRDDFNGVLGHQNTLAPRPERYIAPWPRSGQPGCADGLNKFDLSGWNEEYFSRLKDFCREAGARGIIVEVTLFSQFYHNRNYGPWRINPLNHINNVNGVGQIEYNMFTTMKDPKVLAVQEQLVRKTVRELGGFDNIYYEICNEPNWQVGEGMTADWHNRMIAVIREEEAGLPCRHMIAVNEYHEGIVADQVDVFNFHYSILAFYGLASFYGRKRAVGFDETLSGINGWETETIAQRRMEAWEFMIKGGSLYNYLDVTYSTDDATGTGKVIFPDGQRHDGTEIRKQLQYLNGYLSRLDLISMKPDNGVIRRLPAEATAYVLAHSGKVYVVYIREVGAGEMVIDLPEGEYLVEWFNPEEGSLVERGKVFSTGYLSVTLPLYDPDIVVKFQLRKE